MFVLRISFVSIILSSVMRTSNKVVWIIPPLTSPPLILSFETRFSLESRFKKGFFIKEGAIYSKKVKHMHF